MYNFQEIVKDFCNEYKLNCSIEFRFLDLTSELGEVGKEILKNTDYGKKNFIKNENFELELGDLLFSLLALANTCDVDIFQALFKVLEKYKKRLKNGSVGSESDIL